MGGDDDEAIERIPDNPWDRDLFELTFGRDASGEVALPLVAVMSFVAAALKGEGLQDLVTAESLDSWAPEELAVVLKGHGLSDRVEYPARGWALAKIVSGVEEPIRVIQPREMLTWAVLLRLDDRWRVHALAPRSLAEQIIRESEPPRSLGDDTAAP